MKRTIEAKVDNIGVVAGAGAFPLLLVSYLQNIKKNFVTICLKEHASHKIIKNTKHIFIELGEIGKAITFLKKNRVKHIVFVGKIQRPSLFSIKLDRKGLAFLGRMGINILRGGDDKILSSLVELLEVQGFEVIGPEQILPNLLTPSGVLGKIKPSKQDYEDITVGKDVLAALGGLDIGQAVVVENKYVLGIESAEGTDNLILRSGKLKREKKRLGVLVKMKKNIQETRIDLPGVGVNTVLNAHRAGLRGVAIESKGSLIIDISAVIKKADELGLFLVGIS